jgi:hypothetical protein
VSSVERVPVDVIFLGVEGLDDLLAIALQEDVDARLGGLQRHLALAGQGDAPLEGLQGLLEGQLAALQALDQRLEFGE